MRSTIFVCVKGIYIACPRPPLRCGLPPANAGGHVFFCVRKIKSMLFLQKVSLTRVPCPVPHRHRPGTPHISSLGTKHTPRTRQACHCHDNYVFKGKQISFAYHYAFIILLIPVFTNVHSLNTFIFFSSTLSCSCINH